jgi:hypothetical protein
MGGETSKEGVAAVESDPASSDAAGASGEDTKSMLCGLTCGEPSNEEVKVFGEEETSGVTEWIREGGIVITIGLATGALLLEVAANRVPSFAGKQVSSNTTFLEK